MNNHRWFSYPHQANEQTQHYHKAMFFSYHPATYSWRKWRGRSFTFRRWRTKEKPADFSAGWEL